MFTIRDNTFRAYFLLYGYFTNNTTASAIFSRTTFFASYGLKLDENWQLHTHLSVMKCVSNPKNICFDSFFMSAFLLKLKLQSYFTRSAFNVQKNTPVPY
jgi:hypothetical protein